MAVIHLFLEILSSPEINSGKSNSFLLNLALY
jgi:hypothetical protein